MVQGDFPSAGFEEEKDAAIFVDVRCIQLAPFCPSVMMFILQVGAAVAHWFADMSDDYMLDLLEEWDSYGTMALAAKLDDGRVLFGVTPYSISAESLRCLRADALQHRELSSLAFPRAMALVQAVDGIKSIATSSLAEHPVVEAAYMNTVRTVRTGPVVMPLSSMPLVQRYLSDGLQALSPELDILKRASFPGTAHN